MTVRTAPGVPYPLGATWDGVGVNFALFSTFAEKVELCLFDQCGKRETHRLPVTENTDDVWHIYVSECMPGTLYGYRVFGAYEPENGHRFNHHKLLIDPYARQLSGELHWCDALYGYDVNSDKTDLSFSKQDSAPFMPKCVVVDNAFPWQDKKPTVPWPETIVYEAHVRGFTKQYPQLSDDVRGTFAGLASDNVVDYIKSLGITSLELMPVQYFLDDHFLVKQGLKNYWGYNTLNYFSPVSRYLSGESINEFKQMVTHFHNAGIEVLLDVVYNHTAEGGALGPTLSFKGIDNKSYYRLQAEDQRFYVNDTGCGNTLDSSHPRVLQMIMDSLRYWVSEMHVDGFRFDLAVTLAREQQGFDLGSGFFDVIRQDPVLSQVKLIAEPWDVGPGGYQLGRFPGGWAEWNDHYRDTVRRYWRGDAGQMPVFSSCLHGSCEYFEHNRRRPYASVNMVTSHDGFTLADLVSYRERHNYPNGEDNRDGHHANFSENYGVEGHTDDDQIQALRIRQCKNLIATIMLSQGTPMLLAGDELGRTQQGNNNAYCQDNDTNWIDWSLLQSSTDIADFIRQLTSLRQRAAVLRRDRFVHGREVSARSGFADIEWININGEKMSHDDWHNKTQSCFAMLLSGCSERSVNDDIDVLLIIFNAGSKAIQYILPECANDNIWRCELSTVEDGAIIQIESNQLTVDARSVYVLSLPSAGTNVL